MGPKVDLAKMLDGLARHEPEAEATLVFLYERMLLPAARKKLRGSSLAKSLTDEDLADSVLVSFLEQARAGAIKAQTLPEFAALFATGVDFEVGHIVRRDHTQCRNIDRLEGAPVEEFGALGHEPDPGQAAEASDFWDRCAAELSAEELCILFEHEVNDRTYEEIAGILENTKGAIRKRCKTAVTRLHAKFGGLFRPD